MCKALCWACGVFCTVVGFAGMCIFAAYGIKHVLADEDHACCAHPEEFILLSKSELGVGIGAAVFVVGALWLCAQSVRLSSKHATAGRVSAERARLMDDFAAKS